MGWGMCNFKKFETYFPYPKNPYLTNEILNFNPYPAYMVNVKGGVKSANEEVSQKHVHLFIRKKIFSLLEKHIACVCCKWNGIS